MFVSFDCSPAWTKYVLAGEAFDSRVPRSEIEVVSVALELGSKSSSTAEVKQCIAIRCREIEHRPRKLLALRLFVGAQVDADDEVLHC